MLTGSFSSTITGNFSKINYVVNDGLLDITNLTTYESESVIESFKSRIKYLALEPSTEDFVSINRMARMCWQLRTSKSILNIDGPDSRLLYDIPSMPNFAWVFNILNQVRHLLAETSYSITIGDHAAKNLEIIMNT
jgi:hypothetical protein